MFSGVLCMCFTSLIHLFHWSYFQQACGYEFTNKLHRMFTDVSISTTLNKEFSDFIQSKENVELGVNFSIMVLQVPLLNISICGIFCLFELSVFKFTLNFHDFWILKYRLQRFLKDFLNKKNIRSKLNVKKNLIVINYFLL